MLKKLYDLGTSNEKIETYEMNFDQLYRIVKSSVKTSTKLETLN